MQDFAKQFEHYQRAGIRLAKFTYAYFLSCLFLTLVGFGVGIWALIKVVLWLTGG